MNPCATVFAIAELCAFIVDFLHGSVEDLKSCAVVSPAFTYSAQSHLFYEIDLGKLESSTPQDEDAYARFRECLDASPHLCSFVRRLAIQFELDADLLAYFIGLPLPRLNTLSLFGGYAFYVDAGASIAAQYLLSLPSLHTLIVDACFQESTVLDLLFARYTPTLRTLGFRYVNVKSVASLGKPVSAPKPQIKELRLVHVTRGVTAWLRTPQCPVDVEHIQSLAIYMAIDRELHPLIQAASTTIEELRVHTEDLIYGLSLRSFPALTKLYVVGPDPAALAEALAPESGPPPNLTHLQHITLANRRFQTYTKLDALERGDFGRIDAALADMQELPALERVTLSILRPVAATEDETLATIEQTRAALMVGFPWLRARDVLAVNDYRVVASEEEEELEGLETEEEDDDDTDDSDA